MSTPRSQARPGRAALLVAPLTLAMTAAAAPAAVITEYFNDYGEANLNIVGLSGGSGWSSAYSTSGGSAGDYPEYMAGANLTSSVTGYSNFGNESGANDGSAGQTSNQTSGNRYTYRNITPGLDGTIWISALFRLSEARRIGFGFDSTNILPTNTLEFAPSSGTTQVLKYNNVASNATTANLATGATRLVVMRLTIDENLDGHDRIEVWLPSDVTSIGAMGAKLFDQSGADVFGSSLTQFSITINENANPRDQNIDAIRISNDPQGFLFVTTGVIPEPASLGLLALGGALVVGRRRQ